MPHPELIPPMSDLALPSSLSVERDGESRCTGVCLARPG
jgi:hypothetical protein